MALCKHCGNQIDENTKKCPVCGEVNNVTQGNVVDNGGFLWGLLGCCVPVAGMERYQTQNCESYRYWSAL